MAETAREDPFDLAEPVAIAPPDAGTRRYIEASMRCPIHGDGARWRSGAGGAPGPAHAGAVVPSTKAETTQPNPRAVPALTYTFTYYLSLEEERDRSGRMEA
jgi:hypothetical protein